jgi:enoyl-CoA hydratase
MNENSVQYIKTGHIGYITFNQTDAGLASELAEISAAINGDEEIYAVVVRADGHFFRDAAYLANTEENEVSIARPAASLGEITRPTVAALNGDVIGAGLEIALACDMRIAVENARFGMPQIKFGRIPTDGGTQRLARLVGKGKAMEMILTGELIGASEAIDIGLVNKVVKSESLASEIESLVAVLANKAPLAMRYCKEAVYKGLDLTLEQGLRLEADLYFLLHTTSDRSEGVQSYLQKRKPKYRGS